MDEIVTREIPQKEIERVTEALETVLEQGNAQIDSVTLAQVKLAHEGISPYANGEKVEQTCPFPHLSDEQKSKILQVAVDLEVTENGLTPKDAASLISHLSTEEQLKRMRYNERQEELSVRFGFHPETGMADPLPT